ncbi:MAG TPA: hypothetical protein VFZ64_03650 [Nocardioidaceae bacterium]
MTAGRFPHRAPASAARSSALARWAVRLAGGVVAVVGGAYTILGVAYAVNGDAGISDNWVGMLGAVALLGGLAVSFLAFLMALTLRIRHERHRLLWLPLTVFPALLASTVLFEVFVLE